VEDAEEANMNMLRVWGGGIYEKDIFYSLCDSGGILVWQDFMFANAMYPWDGEFLDDVEAEAEENVRRLADHPCIALWCGNNEIDEAWHNWGWRERYTADESTAIWNGYGELFGKILPHAVSAYGNGAPYISTSPKYGRGDRRSLADGDCHYWGVWHDAEPFEVLLTKTGRFMSEFGFQSFPAVETVSRFPGVGSDAAVPACLESPELQCRQKHPNGNGLILEYMRRDYDVPERFDDFIYVSQLLQARGVRMGIEAQRRASPFCMGSLFWQLGDCWPAVSWSCVDYFGERKALYYQAAKAFSPELISPVVENDTIKVFFVSDSPDSPEGALRLRLLDFDGNLLKEIEEPLPPSLPRGEPLYRIGREALIEGHAAGAVVLTCELVRGRDAAARNLFYFAPPKDLILPDPGLGANVREIPGGGGFIVELVAERIAKDVFLSMPGCVGTFSDNFFDMLPGETVTVIFKTAEKPADPGRRLRIKTLADAR
jgi:beta-mannosidase